MSARASFLSVCITLSISAAPVGCGSAPGSGAGELLDATPESLTIYQVGPGKQFASLQAVASLLKPGDTVQVFGGTTYSGGVRLSAQGTAASKIRVVGVSVGGRRPVLAGGSNTLEFAGNHYVFENFEITGGSTRCVFHHADDITIRGTVIHDCAAHGLLGADADSGSLTFEYNEVYHCGSGDRLHQVYMATDESAYPGAVFRMRYNYIHDGNGGNNVKSRAQRNEIYYNWIEGAFYHELELIDPDGQEPSLAREDSDVVGNVLYQGYTTRSHFPIRIGGDGGGPGTSGRYRFLNNTVVLGNASTSAVFRVFDSIQSVEMHNNVFFRQGGGPVNLLTDADASWTNGRVITGSNNWVTSGSSSIPSGWTGTRQGANPGFADVAGRDLTPTAPSPLRDAGNASPASPSGFPFPSPLAAAAFEPPRHLLLALDTAVRRASVGTLDIGAFELGNTGGSTPPPPPPPPPPSTVTLHPVEDAYARGGTFAANNFGSSTTLDVKTDASASLTRDGYLRFDLGPLTSVSSAKLRFWAALSAADSVSATLYPVTGAWSESTLTWNNRPGFVSTSPLGVLSATSASASWQVLDVTGYVKSERAAGRTRVGFALHASAPSDEKLIIASREAANAPELVVAP